MWRWNDGSDYLMHHGIKGQKWGVRRFQNEDGSLTTSGKERYGVGDSLKSNVHAKPFDLKAYRYDNDSKFNKIGQKKPTPTLTKKTKERSYLDNLVKKVSKNSGAAAKARDTYRHNYQSGDHLFAFSRSDFREEPATFLLNPERLSEEDYIRLYTQLDALKDLENQIHFSDGNFSYSALKEAIGDGLTSADRIQQAFESKLADLMNDLKRCEFAHRNHREKRLKGVDQKVEMN